MEDVAQMSSDRFWACMRPACSPLLDAVDLALPSASMLGWNVLGCTPIFRVEVHFSRVLVDFLRAIYWTISPTMTMGRQRTSAIVIPPGQPQSAAVVAGRVVVVEDLSALPGAFLTLIPRQWVA